MLRHHSQIFIVQGEGLETALVDRPLFLVASLYIPLTQVQWCYLIEVSVCSYLIQRFNCVVQGP